MRPPEFWKADASGRDTALALRALLTPLSWAYAFAAAHRIRTTISRHAPVPVICIGNLTVGGAGKTPIARAIRAKLGSNAHTLSRGYGGRVEGPLRVTPDMAASEVGDEPLLHARDGAAWIARDRLAGALAAAQAGAHAIIMDDGFQNPTLAKDLSIVAVDPGYGVGNGQVFPAGPLRERLADGLARADAIVLLHPQGAEQVEQEWLQGFAKPILHARLEPSGIIPDGPLVAFAGLARPEKFFDTLTSMGAKLADAVPFPDHHPFSDDDLKHLEALAKEHGARLITTEKDAARLSLEWRARVAILPVAARFADDAALENLLAPIRSRMNAPHG
ncbi:tetraacyldisaccharide 4'-kinase [Vitreimonas sp.]|jgi:tetraacyldisaccharide 4'-kinase|uniref:tetraacyldisaccharide 4'-kinase n=1 Tax=Vitreimonas sp. TaxID=3069702 RepID=UPI002ED91E56